MTPRRLRRLSETALATALLLGLGGAALACPSCQEALSAYDPDGANLVKGYFYSILFMLGMPLAMVSIFSLSMYRAVKRAELAREAAASGDEFHSAW